MKEIPISNSDDFIDVNGADPDYLVPTPKPFCAGGVNYFPSKALRVAKMGTSGGIFAVVCMDIDRSPFGVAQLLPAAGARLLADQLVKIAEEMEAVADKQAAAALARAGQNGQGA